MGIERLSQSKTGGDRANRSTATAAAKPPQPTPVHEILRLQKTLGNQAVSRMIQAKLAVGQPGDPYEREADRVADHVVSMPNAQGKSGLTSAPSIQPLSIQRMSANDDKLSRMEEPEKPLQRKAQDEEKPIQRQALKEEEKPVQRKAQDEEKPIQRQALKEEEKPVQRKAQDEEKPVQRKAEKDDKPIQMKEEEKESKAIQRQAKDKEKPSVQMKTEDEQKPIQAKAETSTTQASPKLESRLSDRHGSGTPLAPGVRSFMEPRFGRDFAQVRVHTDGEAVQMNKDLHAQAFTHQHNIYFNQGQYTPETKPGQQLLAHELTHVVQQTGGQPQVSRQSGVVQAKAQPGAAPTKPAKGGGTAKAPKSAAPAAKTPSGKKAAPKKSTEKSKKPAEKTKKPPAEATAASPAAAPTGPAGAPARSGADGLLMPEPPTTLSEADQSRIAGVQQNAAQVASQQSALPDAASNVTEARGAVAEPETETQARAGGDVVAALAQKEPPSPEIEELCNKIRTAIREKRPPDEAQLVKADPTAAAQQSGSQLNSSIQNNAQQAQGSYDQLQSQPQGSPQQQPQPVDAPPASVDTPPPGAQAAVPTPVPAENVSLDADVAAGEKKMQDAGMNSEAAKLVNTGPIAEARAAQGELAETAQRDPAEVMAEQQAALDQAGGDMLALQQAAVAALAAGRATTVTGVADKQQGMVESEEQTRARVGTEAKSIFEAAQKQVNDLLKPLPEVGLKKWDAGVAIASEKFKRRLKKVEDWIKERHAGGWGAVVEVWDDVTGLPGWVIDEYNAAETEFGDDVCALIREISSDVNKVIVTCEGIIADARKQIDDLFKAAFGNDLPRWAKVQKQDFAKKLNNLHDQATEIRNNFNKDLVNRVGTAVQEAREQIHALREKAKGMIGRLADAVNAFLENPGKAILEGLLQLVGIPPASFWALIAKIEKVIDDIANDPMNFANNLMKAIGQGFQQFFDNIGTHLLQGLLEWLLSGLKSVGVTLPKDFSLKSIITFFLQLMGITWARVRKLLVKHIGEKNVALIEKAFLIVADLIALGPEGLFDLLKDKLDPNTIMKQVLDAAIGFLVDALIKQVTARIILLFNPVGAIAQAVEAIYRVLKWIFTNAAKIFSLIETVVDGIANVIAGNIGGMANAVEKALAKLIAPVIDFLADYIGLGDLPEKIADVIKGFQDWVEGILDTVIGWLVEQGKKLLGALIGDKKKPDERTEEQKKADLDTAMGEANQLINDKKLSKQDIEKKLTKIKSHYNMTSLTLVIDNSTETTETYHIHGAINPEADTPNVDKEKTKWPVEENNNIKRVDGNVIEQIFSIKPDQITISLSTRSTKASKPGKEILIFDQFMKLWDSGKFVLSAEKSEAQQRAELEEKFPGKPRIVDAIMERGELREIISAVSGEQAHHLIPIEILEKHYKIQELVQWGWDFNGAINGIALSEGFHGNHPKYTGFVLANINNWTSANLKSNIDELRNYIENQLIPKLKTEIEKAKLIFDQKKAKNSDEKYTLNDYFANK